MCSPFILPDVRLEGDLKLMNFSWIFFHRISLCASAVFSDLCLLGRNKLWICSLNSSMISVILCLVRSHQIAY